MDSIPYWMRHEPIYCHANRGEPKRLSRVERHHPTDSGSAGHGSATGQQQALDTGTNVSGSRPNPQLGTTAHATTSSFDSIELQQWAKESTVRSLGSNPVERVDDPQPVRSTTSNNQRPSEPTSGAVAKSSSFEPCITISFILLILVFLVFVITQIYLHFNEDD